MTERLVSERAMQVCEQAIVWDGHAGFEYAEGTDLHQLERWKNSGVTYLSVNAGYDVKPWQQTIVALARYQNFIDTHQHTYIAVHEVADIRRAKTESKLAIGFDIEGMCSLNEDLNMVSLYHRLGVRQMLIAYNLNNAAGGGCHDKDVGLTEFGRDVIEEMNRVGMLVDCSHSAYRSTMDAMEVSSKPVIFSHSNARFLQDHERNIVDEQILAAAATGGLVGVTGVGIFLDDRGASVEALLRHIDYIADLIGIECIGISLDYDMGQIELASTFQSHAHYWPERQYPGGSDIGFLEPELFPHIADALLQRGYSESATRGVLGENFLRIAAQVWA
jgi:membrane dipeptidase